MKVLVPVDGSSASERAVRHVIDLVKGKAQLEVHLINVQETADAWEVQRFLKPAEIKRTQLEHGAQCLAGAKRLLDRAGVSYETHIAIGDPAEKITQFAQRRKIDKIFMGTHGRAAIAGLLMGSVSTRVLHLAKVPVTLVK